MKKYDWSRERVEKAVAEANCWFDCLDKLAVPKIGVTTGPLKGKWLNIIWISLILIIVWPRPEMGDTINEN